MAEYITQSKESQDKINPALALEMLKEGNKRFLDKNKIDRNYLEQVNNTATGQYPFAAILSCIDSRVPVEIVFDQGIGDVFNARVAGNFINTDILGSIEYACKVAGSKLVVVLGHSGCGAVKGACDHVELGNITPMLDNIMPAVDAVEETGDRSSSNGSFVQKVVEKNVHFNVDGILEKSPVLKEMYDNKEIDIVGAVYDVASGEVSFL
ncbi:carbonic anhydrase family protein [Aureivirga sp. CE67]|uniref:carbonic anhydrase family protein n=1 Tax=Aureivirga sp. CE67 TaxID=1788983 RepID=UPI0018CAB4D3|nr:carbonic anhydrase family protein [Aureivirga sp. CE67]